MPMPHHTMMQVIKRRLVGTEGTERIRVLRAALDELPGYKNGPYADIRKWVLSQIEDTRARSRVVQRDSIAVRREGAAQVAFVGPPNAGKSSLLDALSRIQIKIGNYAFTTLRPVPALTRINDVLIQLVEIPGLIAGASEDRGGGRALLGVLRGADAIVYCQEATGNPQALKDVRAEVHLAGINLPSILVITKTDEAPADSLEQVRHEFPDFSIIGVSIIDDQSLELLKCEIWKLTGLIRVHLRHRGEVDEEPLAMLPGATVTDVAMEIHKEIGASSRAARVWGPSARFDGQQVGRDHPVEDGDTVEVIV